MKHIFTFIILALAFSGLGLNAKAQSGTNRGPQNWQLLGKVDAVYGMKIYRVGEDSYSFESKKAFLYSAFDGERMVYKLFIPIDEVSYTVTKNSSYTGAQVRWTSSGRTIISTPSYKEMFTHKAGPYYLNVENVRN